MNIDIWIWFFWIWILNFILCRNFASSKSALRSIKLRWVFWQRIKPKWGHLLAWEVCQNIHRQNQWIDQTWMNLAKLGNTLAAIAALYVCWSVCWTFCWSVGSEPNPNWDGKKVSNFRHYLNRGRGLTKGSNFLTICVPKQILCKYV